MLYSVASLQEHLRSCSPEDKQAFLLMQYHLREYLNHESMKLVQITTMDIIHHLETTEAGVALLHYTLDRAEEKAGKSNTTEDILIGLLSSLVAAANLGTGAYILGSNANVRRLSITLSDKMEELGNYLSNTPDYRKIPVIMNLKRREPEETA